MLLRLNIWFAYIADPDFPGESYVSNFLQTFYEKFNNNFLTVFVVVFDFDSDFVFTLL